MDEIEFNELYNRVADVIVKWLGIKQDIIDNIKPIL
jgi:two-component SAPR family response regulator